MAAQPQITGDSLIKVTRVFNELDRALIQAGGMGLARPMLDMPLKDFLVILLNNNIYLGATYTGTQG